MLARPRSSETGWSRRICIQDGPGILFSLLEESLHSLLTLASSLGSSPHGPLQRATGFSQGKRSDGERDEAQRSVNIRSDVPSQWLVGQTNHCEGKGWTGYESQAGGISMCQLQTTMAHQRFVSFPRAEHSQLLPESPGISPCDSICSMSAISQCTSGLDVIIVP